MCIFIGVFFIITINLLCAHIKEKKHTFIKGEKSYFTPTLFRLWNNGPFMSLIVPWILDVTVTQIFATMLPFFINYVINPQKYCIKNGIDIISDMCSPTQWLGMTIFVFFTFCIGSTFLWHYVICWYGKKKAWLSYSIISIVTFSLFLLCQEGSMWLLLAFSILNAIPAGGSYLNDVFISDVIDYDEFITGKRNEGIYIVFSSFTPKIVGIFAQSIPLTVMSCKQFINI
jgi:Na+/melibiose symporter-like transporter